MSFKTDELRGLLGKSGPALNNRWEVLLPNISSKTKVNGGGIGNYSSKDLSLLCTTARIPQKVVTTTSYKIGMAETMIGTGFAPGEANFTFYLTNNYYVRQYFQDWLDCVVSPVPPYEAGFFDDYKDTVQVLHKDKLGNTIANFFLRECYPTAVQEIELNNQLATAVSEVTVTFFYKIYEINPVTANANNNSLTNPWINPNVIDVI